ncbi:MAG: hypothetical protein WDA01_11915, partial [Methanothrix sp.]
FIIPNISIISIKWPPVIVFVDTDQKPISTKVVACYRFFWYWFWIPGRYNAGASSKAQALNRYLKRIEVYLNYPKRWCYRADFITLSRYINNNTTPSRT